MKTFRPSTPGQRWLALPSNHELTRQGRKTIKPYKPLLRGKKRTNGRNNNGHITCRHRGGGAKRLYRIVDFKRDKEDIAAKVASVEYDPNRTTHIALLHYADGEKRYILAPEGLKKGDVVMTGDQPPFNKGCCMRLKAMPLGSMIHNIEIQPGKGGKLVRAAGMSAQLMAKSGGYVTIKMPSGEVRLMHENCRATLGRLSNSEQLLRVDGKAGRRRWLGFRSTVRGTAMNPVDHPHGGGEGRHNGYIPRTPWGEYTKGYRTRPKYKSNDMIIKRRRK